MKIKTTIKFKSFNNYKLNQIILDLKKDAESNELVSNIVSLPKKKKRITLLRSPHVHKKARDQFEIQTHTKLLNLEGSKKKIKEFFHLLKNNTTSEITYIVNFKKVNKL
jgi:small subunit ribosomal protein S10